MGGYVRKPSEEEQIEIDRLHWSNYDRGDFATRQADYDSVVTTARGAISKPTMDHDTAAGYWEEYASWAGDSRGSLDRSLDRILAEGNAVGQTADDPMMQARIQQANAEYDASITNIQEGATHIMLTDMYAQGVSDDVAYYKQLRDDAWVNPAGKGVAGDVKAASLDAQEHYSNMMVQASSLGMEDWYAKNYGLEVTASQASEASYQANASAAGVDTRQRLAGSGQAAPWW